MQQNSVMIGQSSVIALLFSCRLFSLLGASKGLSKRKLGSLAELQVCQVRMEGKVEFVRFDCGWLAAPWYFPEGPRCLKTWTVWTLGACKICSSAKC